MRWKNIFINKFARFGASKNSCGQSCYSTKDCPTGSTHNRAWRTSNKSEGNARNRARLCSRCYACGSSNTSRSNAS